MFGVALWVGTCTASGEVGGERTREVESGKDGIASLLMSFIAIYLITVDFYGNTAVALTILQIRFCSFSLLIEM